MTQSDQQLVRWHLSASFAAFVPALVLGAWQMWERSPWPAPLQRPDAYYLSLTVHGVLTAYVLTTFFAMGFGYWVAATALDRPIEWPRVAWAGFWATGAGAVLAAGTVIAGKASVLYTFYPPLTAYWTYYAGLLLLVLGSWTWAVLMVGAMRGWKARNPGARVPLAMFGTVATALLWLWTSFGMVLEITLQILPAAFGRSPAIDVGLARTLFSWTLHGIVYFWLLPVYVAFYAMVPRAAGGWLFSDTAARISFVMFIIFAVPVGLHHLFMDPEHGSGFKFLQTVFSAMVVAPTILTIFTVSASLEIAGRLRGGTGLFGWIGALPYDQPLVLGAGLSAIMLGLGGFSGTINMSYAMNSMVHNTHWIPAHLHLIFAGAVVIMYMAVAYEIWPSITGHSPSRRLVRVQLWTWCIGMLVTTLPWHVAGLLGQARRVSSFDYTQPALRSAAALAEISVLGGALLLLSGLLFAALLLPLPRRQAYPTAWPFARSLDGDRPLATALNDFRTWNALLLLAMVVCYGWPILQFFVTLHGTEPLTYPAGGAL